MYLILDYTLLFIFKCDVLQAKYVYIYRQNVHAIMKHKLAETLIENYKNLPWGYSTKVSDKGAQSDF